MDDLRAMREARYEQAQARGAQAITTTRTAPSRPQPTRSASPSDGLPESGATEALCGHRAISGRTCTREAGHSAKSHRYA